MDKTHISAILLAGGQGSRMGGRDKALVEHAGRPMVEHVVDAIKGSVGRIVISYNRSPEHLAHLGCEVVPDELEGFQGPLSGVASCLGLVDTGFTLVVPCDTPDLPRDLVARLAGAMDEALDVVYARDPERAHPLIMLARTTALASIRDYLMESKRSVMGWCESQSCGVAEFPDASAFRNINEKRRRET